MSGSSSGYSMPTPVDSNFKDLLIEIFVPLADGSGGGRIGTGIPIAENRILTAGHVLLDASLDLAADFEIRWHHWRDSGEAPGDWARVERTQIRYPAPGAAEGAPDAAVFEHPFPTKVRRWCEPTDRNYATGTPWEGEGFPDVGRRDDRTRVAVPLRGATYQCANRAREAWLDVVAPARLAADWKGASGCPVMVCGRVAGLLTEVPPGFGSDRLMALPLRRLLQEPGFCTAIGRRPGGERLTALTAELERARKQAPVAVGALECFVEGRPEGALFRDPAKPIDQLACALAEQDAARMLLHAIDAISALKPDHLSDAKALAKLVQRLLPILYGQAAVDGLSERVADPREILSGFPVATRCAAEVVMAGACRRETRYWPPVEGRELEGTLCLTRPPIGGISPGGEQNVDAVSEHLRRKLTVNDLGAFTTAFHRRTREFLCDSAAAARGMDEERLLTMAAARLKYLAGHQERRYYYSFELPSEFEASATCLETVRKLKERFSAVTFLELAGDAALYQAEFEDFLPLSDILDVLED